MLSELKTFIAVCRHGTFAAAGDRIGLSQSAVSSQIKRLEETLGFELFDRTGRSATLNAAGQATLVRAEEIHALYAKLAELPSEGIATGLLRIGAIASVQPTLLARALALLRGEHPQLRVHVVPGVSMKLMDELDAGKIDAAVIIRPPFGMLPDLTWQSLIREPFVLLVAADVKGTDWRALVQDQPFLRYERTSFGGRMVERFLRHEGLAVHDAVEADEIPALIHMVAKGLGVALVPLVEAHQPLPPNVRVLTLGAKTFYREIGLLQRRPRASTPAVALFSECLRQAAEVQTQAPGTGRAPPLRKKTGRRARS
ncbi:LysR family transcriptional regulator [Acidovorax sp. LjRoot129]|uniref:LysR family transcriptional regulator n=1 Tax=Acidovorax sp. LjRoot129 TaxID=3342260 RepID=UPI003ED106F9